MIKGCNSIATTFVLCDWREILLPLQAQVRPCFAKDDSCNTNMKTDTPRFALFSLVFLALLCLSTETLAQVKAREEVAQPRLTPPAPMGSSEKDTRGAMRSPTRAATASSADLGGAAMRQMLRRIEDLEARIRELEDGKAETPRCRL